MRLGKVKIDKVRLGQSNALKRGLFIVIIQKFTFPASPQVLCMTFLPWSYGATLNGKKDGIFGGFANLWL